MIADKTYSVAVVATMSAGKSTLLNAMIGLRLLPSRNEACTATVFKVLDVDERMGFRARSVSPKCCGDWVEEITQNELSRWNGEVPLEIQIEGNLPYIYNTRNHWRVAFVDTPGPNNSTCKAHAQVTERIIAESDYSSIVFVINASVAGVEDEERFLSRLKSLFEASRRNARIYFVVNKIDLLDPGMGESVSDVLIGCERQLRDIGFKSPQLIPTCGETALLIRQVVRSAIPFVPGVGKPRLSKAMRVGAYEAVGAPRMLAKVRRNIEMLLAARQFYRSGLQFSELGKSAFAKVGRSRRKCRDEMKRLCIAGRFFTRTEIRSAIKLTGVPVLEYVLESELEHFSIGDTQ